MDSITIPAADSVERAWQTVEASDAELRYCPALFDADQADRLLAALLDTTAWEQHVIRMGARRIPCPRLSAWYGDPGARYTYSGLSLEPAPWTPAVAQVRTAVEAAVGACFNSVLLNLYRDGADSMGWHADREPELGPEPLIASVSLGAVRDFVLRHRRRKDLPTLRLPLGHGSLLLMAGPTQHHWRHALPRTRRPVGPRVNLTFRRIVAPRPLSPG